jgi:hypothetical protein
MIASIHHTEQVVGMVQSSLTAYLGLGITKVPLRP